MLLVDTNIIAPLFLRGTDSTAVAALFMRDPVWRTEPLALIEFSNVLTTYERSRHITAATARDCLHHAVVFLQPNLFRVTHQAALDLALRYQVTAYDGRFLALADQLGGLLVTEDSRLRAAAPQLTQSIKEALAAA